MTPAAPSAWVVRSRQAKARLRLLCFPYAGGGASTFRTWSPELPPMVEVCAIQPPGREGRLNERPIGSLSRLVDSLVEATRACREQPFAFFGHSIGALVAFELTRALRRRGEATPVQLFVSGCGAPHLVDGEMPLSTLPDAELLERLRRLDGTPHAVLEHAEMMELFLPTLRADLGLRDGYACMSERPLDIPITALGGQHDPEVSQASLAAWRDQTRARFALHGFPGGHFFIHSARALLLRALSAELTQLLDVSAALGAKDHHAH